MDRQNQWFKLCEQLGSEEAAEQEVVRQLRLFADLIERKGYPKIFGVDLSIQPTGNGFNGFPVESITVILSYPWPG